MKTIYDEEIMANEALEKKRKIIEKNKKALEESGKVLEKNKKALEESRKDLGEGQEDLQNLFDTDRSTMIPIEEDEFIQKEQALTRKTTKWKWGKWGKPLLYLTFMSLEYAILFTSICILFAFGLNIDFTFIQAGVIGLFTSFFRSWWKD